MNTPIQNKNTKPFAFNNSCKPSTTIDTEKPNVTNCANNPTNCTNTHPSDNHKNSITNRVNNAPSTTANINPSNSGGNVVTNNGASKTSQYGSNKTAPLSTSKLDYCDQINNGATVTGTLRQYRCSNCGAINDAPNGAAPTSCMKCEGSTFKTIQN